MRHKYFSDEENEEDYYGTHGCCLTCEDKEDGCLCFSCRCRKCRHYRHNETEEYRHDVGGFCNYRNRMSGYMVLKIIRKTDKAVFAEICRFGSVWIPISVIVNGSIKQWFIDKLEIKKQKEERLNERKSKSFKSD